MALLTEEARQDGEPGDRNGDEAADHAAETEGRTFEELAPRKPLAGLRMRHRRATGLRRRAHLTCAGRPWLSPLRLDDERPPAQLRGRLARPEGAEDQRDRAADRRDP